MSIKISQLKKQIEPVNFNLSFNSSFFLDLIRVIASQAVLIGHAFGPLKINNLITPPSFVPIQDIAVSIFFILSGFLIPFSIERNLVRNKLYSFKHFFIDRFSRIYSALVPSLLIVVLLDIIVIYVLKNSYPSRYNFDLISFIGEFFLLSEHPLFPSVLSEQSKFLNLIGIKSAPWGIAGFGTARPFWTLRLEWWIYMFIGFLFLGKATFKRSKVLYTIIFLLVFLTPIQNRQGLFAVWCLGWLGYIAISRGYLSILRVKFSFALSFIFGSSYIYYLSNSLTVYDRLGPLQLSLIVIFTLNGLNQIEEPLFSKWRPLIKYLADYSFTLYLVHFSLIYLYAGLEIQIEAYLNLLIIFIISNIIAIFIAKYGEFRHLTFRNFLRLKFLK